MAQSTIHILGLFVVLSAVVGITLYFFEQLRCKSDAIRGLARSISWFVPILIGFGIVLQIVGFATLWDISARELLMRIVVLVALGGVFFGILSWIGRK